MRAKRNPSERTVNADRLKDRYDALWQDMIDELARERRIAGEPRAARLLVLGAVNWTGRWYRGSGRLSVDEIAAQIVKPFLRSPRR